MYICKMQNERKEFIRSVFQRSANKYTIVGMLFILWIGLFDKYSIIDQLQLRAKIDRLESEKRYYQKKIKVDSTRLEELRSNRENLEKFAREQYLMKKEKEDIFIIVKD